MSTPMESPRSPTGRTAFLFDLDGTLVDSVYQHVLACARGAGEGAAWSCPSGAIHRRIGMSGGLLLNALLRETGRGSAPSRWRSSSGCTPRPTPAWSPRSGRCRAPATCWRTSPRPASPGRSPPAARGDSARPALEVLGLGPDVPVITRDMVAYAKPDPDLFLAAADRLGVPITDSVVVGDSVWDLLAARRALRTGRRPALRRLWPGRARTRGAYRVYQDPADLQRHLDEVGVRVPH